jgi:hypothetical protein
MIISLLHKSLVFKLFSFFVCVGVLLCFVLCYELLDANQKNDKDWSMKVNNFFRFMMDNFETELVIMGTRLALVQYQLPLDPDEISCFDEFHKRYGKFITRAAKR